MAKLSIDVQVREALVWETGWYEARMLTSFVDEPERVTAAQMDRWCRDFDNWGICDTVCFHLFDRTPHAWAKVLQWSKRKPEFEKRAAFALLASLARHDKKAMHEQLLGGLALIEREAADEQNFVMKGVNWALRRIGGRNPAIKAAAVAVAKRLAESPDAAARWVGKGCAAGVSQARGTKNERGTGMNESGADDGRGGIVNGGRRWRSAGALVAGFAVVVVLSLGVDAVLHTVGVFPPWGDPVGDGPLALATVYRTIFGIIGSYLVARLAPDRPMGHALVSGVVGTVAATAGAAATWNGGPAFGPHWYPLALIAGALPGAWVGGKLYEMRSRGRAVAAGDA